MNYEFTKDCEIMNCEFLEGEIVDAKAVQFYPTVMKQTEEDATHTVTKTGDTLVKTEAEEPKKEKAPAKKGAKKEKAPEEETPDGTESE